MTEVLEARKAFDDERADSALRIARRRAALGLTMIRARERAGESQTTIARQMNVGPQQVRAYEQAYREWAKEHPGEQP
jgi:transcriptional regulator with XRE-family HTH domain